MTFICSIITKLLRYMRTFMLNSLQESKILTFAPKMSDILGFQGVYLGAWGQV